MSRAWCLVHGALAAAALVLGCFRPDYLDYAACRSSEPCAEGGLDACVLIPAEEETPGYCADRCAGDNDCTAGQDGDAAPRCLPVAGLQFCALDCLGDRTCPSGYLCREVVDGEGELRELCFPDEEAPP